MFKNDVQVLIITPPRRATLANIIAKKHLPLNQGIDSIPLRLAAVIEKEYSVDFLPLYYTQYNYYKLDYDSIKKELNRISPKIIIISNDYFISNRSTACFPAALEIAAVCKETLRNVKIVLTGKHAIVRPYEAFKFSNSVDVVIAQEPEEFINTLIKYLLNDNVTKLSNLPSVYYKQYNEIKESGFCVKSPDINILPPPAYHLLKRNIDNLVENEKPYGTKIPLTLRTSYGCVYNCPYCGGIKSWNDYRLRNKAGVKADINEAINSLGNNAEFIFLDDELFTANKNHVEEVANIFQQKNIILDGILTHTKYFDNSIAQIVKKFCNTVIFGAENFNNNILKSIGKNQTREDIINAVTIAKNYRLNTRLEYIVGLPEETSTTIIENLNFIYNAIVQGKVDIIIPYLLTPHPGTKYGDFPNKYGITICNFNYEDYIEEIGYPAYYTKNLTREKIFAYYMLLKNVINMAISIRNFSKNENFSIEESSYNKDLFEKIFNEIN